MSHSIAVANIMCWLDRKHHQHNIGCSMSVFHVGCHSLFFFPKTSAERFTFFFFFFDGWNGTQHTCVDWMDGRHENTLALFNHKLTQTGSNRFAAHPRYLFTQCSGIYESSYQVWLTVVQPFIWIGSFRYLHDLLHAPVRTEEYKWTRMGWKISIFA